MAKRFQERLLRNFHNMPPAKFHAFNQRVENGLTTQANIPDNVWGANPELLSLYLAASKVYDLTYHEACHGSRLAIAQREVLQAQLVNYLDEIASALEAAAVRNPEILVASGYDVTKERRGRTRAKVTTHASEEAMGFNSEHPT